MSSEMHVVEPKINPQAVVDYYTSSNESGKSTALKDVQMKAKQHLAAMGWSFIYIVKKSGKRELRYCPPDGKKKYISLRMACKGYLDSQPQLERKGGGDVELQCGKSSVDVGEANGDVSRSKKRRLGFGDVCGERMLACMKGKKDVGGEDDVLVEDTLSEEENFAEFYADLHGEVDSENVSVDTESEGYNSGELFLSEREESKLDNRVKKRKIGGKGRGSRGKLALFLKCEVIKPLAKVYYRNKRDGSVMGEGRVTSEGVDCSCCKRVFSLTGFETHVGSTYHRPAEHTFLEDGRSLMQIEQEMGAGDKQVKIIKKKVKVTGTMQQNRHDDFCLVCRDIGDLILCHQCTSAFHPHCLALSNVPAGEFWCATCCCKICGQKCPKDDSEPTNTCDQCEQQFHVKCLGECCVADLERMKWFCSEKCKVVSSGLGKLLGKTFEVGENNLSWTVLKNESNVIDVKTTKKLNSALAVMHECFQSVKEPFNGRDVSEDVIFSRPSQMKRLDY